MQKVLNIKTCNVVGRRTSRRGPSVRPAPDTNPETRFWAKAEPLLALAGVTRSTMMGLPCLRVNSTFFASFDRSTSALLVKLPEAVVDDLVATGRAESFAPAGRRFREWAAIPVTNSRTWRRYLERAHQHVSTLPTTRTRRRR